MSPGTVRALARVTQLSAIVAGSILIVVPPLLLLAYLRF